MNPKPTTSGPFIVIGSKGTSLPPDLTDLTPPLQIGANGIAENKINWSREPFRDLGKRAHGWVSEAKKGDPFFIYPLSQALGEKRVVHITNIEWISNGQRFLGEAFFPEKWKLG